MNALKLTPIAALLSAALLAGCGNRDEPAAGNPNGTTSGTTGNTATTPAAGSGATASGSPSAGTASTGSTSSAGTGATVAGGTGGSMSGSSAGATTSGTRPSTAPGAAPTPAAAGGALALADKNFITTAAVGGMYEVEAGKLAAERASDPAVKAYAQKLAEHHAQTNEELQQLAQAKGVPLPDQLPADKRKELDKLSKAKGTAFDRQYVQQVGLKDHQADIRSFEKAAKDTKDADLKAFAQKTLPVLQQHLAQAKMLPGGGQQGQTTSRANNAGDSTASSGMASPGATPSAGATPSPATTPGGSTTGMPPPAGTGN